VVLTGPSMTIPDLMLPVTTVLQCSPVGSVWLLLLVLVLVLVLPLGLQPMKQSLAWISTPFLAFSNFSVLLRTRFGNG